MLEKELEHSIALFLDLVEETRTQSKSVSNKLKFLKERHIEEIKCLLNKQSKETGKTGQQLRREIEHLKSCHVNERRKVEEENKIAKEKLKNFKDQLDTLNSLNILDPPCPECPVCLETMKPPEKIIQCNNGHLLCEDCSKSEGITSCPTCREGLTGRAIAMEQHLRVLYKVE